MAMDAKTAGKLIATGWVVCPYIIRVWEGRGRSTAGRSCPSIDQSMTMDARPQPPKPTHRLGFGCVHVLSGADHLSALATLSVGSRFKAFSLGIRWGLGHSSGLILVGGILLGLGDKINAEKVEHYCNWVVGVFMIALGVWGVFKARKRKRERESAEAAEQGRELATAAAALEDGITEREQQAIQGGDEEEGRVRQGQGQGQPGAAAAAAATATAAAAAAGAGTNAGGTGSKTSSSDEAWSADDGDEEEIMRLPINGAGREQQDAAAGRASATGSAAAMASAEGGESGGLGSRDGAGPLSPGPGGVDTASPSASDRAAGGAKAGPGTPTREPLIFLDDECEGGEHAVLRCCRCLHLVDIESPLVQRIVAFVVGLVHGIAGPGGILGVLPAVQLHSWQKASLYLGTFCFASTLIMVRGPGRVVRLRLAICMDWTLHMGGWMTTTTSAALYTDPPNDPTRPRPTSCGDDATHGRHSPLDTHTHTYIHTRRPQGIFAALYGELSARVASAKKMEFQMEIFSASLSIIVGILWIALTLAGKLSVVFG
jgi:ABC-type nickel/cobalt efflux system permease component RcnA